MTPSYFGDSQQALFGCFHPAEGDRSLERGVLLCAPVAQENIRTSWGLRQLAGTLAREGFDVFRFDYSCVGDSWGDSAEARLGQWVADIGAACAELRDVSGVRRVSLVGLRLGGALAARALGEGLEADTLVLWDPVVRGARYLAELETLHGAMLTDPNRFPLRVAQLLSQRWPTVARFLGGSSHGGQLVGFPFGPPLRLELNALDLPTDLANTTVALGLVTTEVLPEYDYLRTTFGSRPVACRSEGTPGRWNEVAAVEQALLPGTVHRLIASLLIELST